MEIASDASTERKEVVHKSIPQRSSRFEGFTRPDRGNVATTSYPTANSGSATANLVEAPERGCILATGTANPSLPYLDCRNVATTSPMRSSAHCNARALISGIAVALGACAPPPARPPRPERLVPVIPAPHVTRPGSGSWNAPDTLDVWVADSTNAELKAYHRPWKSRASPASASVL